MKQDHIVWFDVETTGVSISTDRIIEICMIKTDLNGKEVDRFYSLINPEGMREPLLEVLDMLPRRRMASTEESLNYYATVTQT